jgi:hypothetical protein
MDDSSRIAMEGMGNDLVVSVDEGADRRVYVKLESDRQVYRDGDGQYLYKLYDDGRWYIGDDFCSPYAHIVSFEHNPTGKGGAADVEVWKVWDGHAWHNADVVVDKHSGEGSSKHEDMKKRKKFAYRVQCIILLTHLFILHIFWINQWSMTFARDDVVSLVRCEHFISLLTYIVHTAYLVLLSIQLKYDVQVTEGGVRFVHTMNLWKGLNHKMMLIYKAVPFLHEMRVLTDWTSTPTSMNFFMWMKLEDAHHILFRVKRDMDQRAALGEKGRERKISRTEKNIMGCGGVSILMCLLLGPVLFFSSLATSAFGSVANPVISATMTIGIEAVSNCRAIAKEEKACLCGKNEDGCIENDRLDSKACIAAVQERVTWPFVLHC